MSGARRGGDEPAAGIQSAGDENPEDDGAESDASEREVSETATAGSQAGGSRASGDAEGYPADVVGTRQPERRARMSGPQRREQLLGVGRAVFAERGYEAASIEEIAERAGVSKPVVYEHFGGKEGLYAVVIDREVRTLLEAILTALRTAEHPRAMVESAADAFLHYIEREQDGFRILIRDAPVSSGIGTLSGVIGNVAANAESILAEQFTARGYDPATAPLYARALVGMVAMVGEWWLEAGAPRRPAVVAHLVNLAWNGLKDLDPDPFGQATSPMDPRSV